LVGVVYDPPEPGDEIFVLPPLKGDEIVRRILDREPGRLLSAEPHHLLARGRVEATDEMAVSPVAPDFARLQPAERQQPVAQFFVAVQTGKWVVKHGNLIVGQTLVCPWRELWAD